MQQESAQLLQQSFAGLNITPDVAPLSIDHNNHYSIRDLLSKKSLIIPQQLFNDKFIMIPNTSNSTNQLPSASPPNLKNNQARQSKKEIKFIQTKGLVLVTNNSSTPINNGSTVQQGYKDKYLETGVESKKNSKLNIALSMKQSSNNQQVY